MDGEFNEVEFIDSVKNDSELQVKWCSYYVICSGFCKEVMVMLEFDIIVQVVVVLENEVIVLVFKLKWQFILGVNKIVLFMCQFGQFVVVVFVVVVVILGVQQMNQFVLIELFMMFQIGGIV